MLAEVQFMELSTNGRGFIFILDFVGCLWALLCFRILTRHKHVMVPELAWGRLFFIMSLHLYPPKFNLIHNFISVLSEPILLR